MYLDNLKVRWDYENKTDGLTVAEHHEWGRKDEIEKLPIVPIITLDTASLRIIETRQDKFPQSILKEALNKFSLRDMRNHNMDTDDYNIILTDGERSIIVSIYLRDNTVNCYGRMILKRENLMLKQLKEESRTIVTRDIVEEMGEEENPKTKEFTDLEYEHIVGTTQTERKMKKLLLHNMTYIANANKEGLIKYFYTGLFPDKKVPHNKSDKKMFDEMVEFVRIGWTREHERFGTEVIQFVKSYENSWAALVAKKGNLDGVC